MKNARRTSALLACAMLAGPAAVLVASPASADVERTVTCGAGVGDLSVDREGRLNEVSLDIDNVAPGSRWKVVIRKDGKRLAKVVRAADREGDVDVDRVVRNTKGTDRFAFRATRIGSATSCSASLSA